MTDPRFVEVHPPLPHAVLEKFRDYLKEEVEAMGMILLTKEEYRLLKQRAGR